MAKSRVLGRISKVEEQADGTLLVYGIATTPTRDSDGERITAECMKDAIPEYMKKRRALREMHQPIAAGTTKELFVDDDGNTHIVAHVVDPVSAKKVQAGVLKMFSVEGLVPKGGRDSADPKTINKLKLREISLVDVGANPDADLEGYEVMKLDGDTALEAEDVETPAVEPVADPPAVVKVEDAPAEPGVDPVAKGLYSIASFAEVLQSVGNLAASSQYEADWEGDQSPIPAKLRAWFVAGANILKAMTQEETDELLASITPPDPTPTVEVIAQVDGPVAGQDDVEKKGAKFSADTKKKIAAAMEALKALGADDESSEKLDAPTLDEDAISKLKTEWEAAYTGDRVSKITAERDGLVAEVATLREEAAKSEAALADVVKAMKVKGFLRLVDKATDGAPIAKAEGASDEGADTTDPLAAIRKVHSSGGVVINARG